MFSGDDAAAAAARRPRPPSLLDALLPVIVLIALIALTIVLFGISATDGPLQVALLLSAAFASLVALKTTGRHIRNMFWTAGPALGLSLIAFLILGLTAKSEGGVSTQAALDVLEAEFNTNGVALLPLALLVVFTLKKVPPFLAILGSALFAGILACFIQWDVVKSFVGEPHRSAVGIGIKAVYGAMATGFVSRSGNPAIDSLFSRGGMSSLLTTIWLVLAALAFAAIMEHAGFLRRLLEPVVAHARTRGRLILAVNGSAVGLNVVAGDQYVADVLPSRMFSSEFERRGLAPEALSRGVEDSGTVTSVLVPWNTCGAYISGVLGVATASYFPYCFFNFLSPVLDVAYGFLGFKVPKREPA